MLPSKLHAGLMSEKRMEPPVQDQLVPRRKTARFQQPMEQQLDAFPRVDFGRPPRRGLELSRVRDVISLIARTPFLEPDSRLLALEPGHQLEQFEQADRVPEPAADIERLPGKRMDLRLR